ncbi:MAG: cadmium-translocating P-type ATPase [Rhodospirillaceae bacterium]|nr:MAG: cadmium-translocating P-type ATPase [Rhodospirillaceae bacterium]
MGTELRYQVEGMDCPSCAGKVERAVSGIPGVLEVSVNYSAASLKVRSDERPGLAEAIAEASKRIGHPLRATNGFKQGLTAIAAEGGDAQHEGDAISRAWWWQTKVRAALTSVVALGLAALLSEFVIPTSSLILYTAAVAIGIYPIAHKAIRLATAGSPFSMEMLMTVAALGAVAIGAPIEAAIFIFLFTLGELLENVAAARARSGITSMLSVIPTTATVLTNGSQRQIAAQELTVGMTVLVRPGERIPTDGSVSEGTSSVDQSAVTGESVPVVKSTGDEVFAGTINNDGSLTVAVTKPASDTLVARMLHLVEEAQESKAPISRFIDRFSAIYTPMAMAGALLVAIVPPLAFGASWHVWIYRSLSLLLIACPCALVISTPAAIAAGLAAGARHGLLVKGGAALEMLSKIRAVAFDKTGTLTIGKPAVTNVVEVGQPVDDVLAWAAAAESTSTHPIANAIVHHAKSIGLAIPQASNGRAVPGKSVYATVQGRDVSVMSPRAAASIIGPEVERQIEALEARAKTVVVVKIDDKVAGLIALRDEPRTDAAVAVSRLKAMRIGSVLLSGDNHRSVTAIGRELGIHVRGELLPEHKVDQIRAMKAREPVAMIGDGINDAPALAAASVGIAMGGGTDVAIETADVALMKDRVTGVAEVISLARTTMANVRQNIAISLGLKAIFLVTSLSGATPLWMAILADTGATVIVTANALRLLGFRSK